MEQKHQPEYTFACGDNIGYVIDTGGSIQRLAYPEHAERIEKLYSLYVGKSLSSFNVIDTRLDKDNNRLTHRKLPITYPHEWPPSMFKDAVLFHLDLLLHLHSCGITLKDGLPENILFNGVRPVFVDFFSLVLEPELAHESWLASSCPQGVDLRLHALRLMFVPHMLIPLLCYALGDFTTGRMLLAERFCNNTTGKNPSWSDLPHLRGLQYLLHACRDRRYTFVVRQVRAVRNACDDTGLDWPQRLRRLRALMEGLDVAPPESAYITYYEDKKENLSFVDASSWQEKQLGVQQVLRETQPKTLLDLGANTGWFSQLACQMGASVIATDIDIACADAIYRTAAFCRLPLTPLYLSFDELQVEHFACCTGDHAQVPIHMAALKRLQSDCVLCLGLLHHLTLGLGKSFADVLEHLSVLTRDTLILEFVGLNDRLVCDDPDFFPNISAWTWETYSLEIVKQAAATFFRQCAELPSTPAESRTLLVLRR